MKMVKSLLLASAAGLVATAGAQAADLPVKAKAVEYVKICSLYGIGFYYIPGTDTCIRIGGHLQAKHQGRDCVAVLGLEGSTLDRPLFPHQLVVRDRLAVIDRGDHVPDALELLHLFFQCTCLVRCVACGRSARKQKQTDPRKLPKASGHGNPLINARPPP